ncbi:MAG TPA: DUF6152 family protein [Gammaproteobacteria bacterium]
MMRIGLFFIAILSCGVALGHHSFGAFFDVETVGEISGELVAAHWVNPHTTFTVRTDDGELWTIETAPVNSLQRLGLADTVEAGDRVAFYGAFSRIGRNELLAINMTLPDGHEVLLDPGLTPRFGLQSRVDASANPAVVMPAAAEEPAGIFRVWSRARGPNDLDPDRTFSPAALAARAVWNPVADDPALRCIAPGMPVVMDTPFPLAFEQGDGAIVLRIEQWDGERVIHMDPDAAPAGPMPMGHSIGHWEGRALVVETSEISWPYVDEFGTPKSDAYSIVERFTFGEDNRSMTWEATATDPLTYEGPAFLGRAGYEWIPGEELKPYDCTIAANVE